MSGAQRLEGVRMTRDGVRIELLGGFGLLDGIRRVRLPKSAQRLVALLATRSLTRFEAADLLWPEAEQGRTSGNLRTALWRVQQTLPGLIDVSGGSILQLRADVVVDLAEYARWAAALGAAVRSGSPFGEFDRLTPPPTASRVLLPDWYDDWLVLERERFRQLWLHASEDYARICLLRRRHGDAVQAVLSVIAEEPLRESSHRLLIEIDLDEANRGEAFRHYQMCRELVRRELGAEPSFSIQELLVGNRYPVRGGSGPGTDQVPMIV